MTGGFVSSETGPARDWFGGTYIGVQGRAGLLGIPVYLVWACAWVLQELRRSPELAPVERGALLASIGLYGMTSYIVAMRGREIAVRMALGARAGIVIAMVLRQALAVATIGAVLGGLVAIAAGLVIRAEVFGVAGVDIAILGGSAALLAVAMLLASILPAWRAARLDPNTVLRQE